MIKAKDNYRQTALVSTWFYRIAHHLLIDHHKRLTLVVDNTRAETDEPIDQLIATSPNAN